MTEFIPRRAKDAFHQRAQFFTSETVEVSGQILTGEELALEIEQETPLAKAHYNAVHDRFVMENGDHPKSSYEDFLHQVRRSPTI